MVVFSTNWIVVQLFFFALMAATADHGSGDGGRYLGIEDLRNDVALVEGHVSSLSPVDRDIAVEISVDHVFFGQNIRAGEAVLATAWGPARVGDTIGKMLYPAPQVGERGIWAVQLSGTQREIITMGVLFNGVFPARKSDNVGTRFNRNEFADGLDLAKLIERIGKSDRKSCVSILSDSALSATPEISAWSVRALGQVDPEALHRLATDQETNFRLPRCGKMALDKALAEVDAEWRTSAARYNMLLQAANNCGSEYEQSCIVLRLGNLAQHPDMPMLKIMEAIKAFALDRAATENFRRRMTVSLKECHVGSPAERRARSESLSEVARNSDSKVVRDQASYEILQLDSWPASRP